MTERVDCAIVGGGPAGLVAALYLLRFRRSVLLADKGPSRAALIPRSHNYPGFPDGVHGLDLLDRLRQQAEHYGTPRLGKAVTRVEKGDDDWRIVMADEVVLARQVLFATGVVDRWPRMSNAAKAIEDAALRFCPICDGFEANDLSVAVIGDDDHAAREALFLKCYSSSVHLLSGEPHLSHDMLSRLRAAGLIATTITPGSLKYANGAISAAESQTGRVLSFRVAYGALGVDPQTELLADLGVRLDAGGCVDVDAHQQTSVPGIYAAGDMVRGLHQISVAVGEAAIAATAIHNMLREED
jgi:thioredoxin reductase (NADPH)